MKKVKVYTVDTFTDQAFQGNAAAVIFNAETLTENEMQMIAKEINLSETAFVLKTDNSQATFKIRYFTPSIEIDFCGHATIALSWVVVSEGYIGKNQPLILETNIGLIPIQYEYAGHKLSKVTMTQVEPEVKSIDYDIDNLCHMVGLNEQDLDMRFPIKMAYTGNWHLLIPVKYRNSIDKATPNFKLLKEHNLNHKISTTHLFTFDTMDELSFVYTRDFAPSSGIDEDPVTGSANGALAGYLILEGIVKEEAYQILQGNSLNRFGKVEITSKTMPNQVKIQVGGSAVIIIEGFLNL